MSISSSVNAGRAERLEVRAQRLLDLGRVLIGNESEAELHAGLGGQHRLGPAALVTAPDAVDVAGRTRPAPFEVV